MVKTFQYLYSSFLLIINILFNVRQILCNLPLESLPVTEIL